MLCVTIFCGGTALEDDIAAWNQVLNHGFIAGDGIGNSATAYSAQAVFWCKEKCSRFQTMDVACVLISSRIT